RSASGTFLFSPRRKVTREKRGDRVRVRRRSPDHLFFLSLRRGLLLLQHLLPELDLGGQQSLDHRLVAPHDDDGELLVVWHPARPAAVVQAPRSRSKPSKLARMKSCVSWSAHTDGALHPIMRS